MGESELIREAYEFLGRGRFEAAQVHFEQYMARRVRVVGDGPLRDAWERSVAEKREQIASQEAAARQKKGWKGRANRLP
jgi:hypothetical protein